MNRSYYFHGMILQRNGYVIEQEYLKIRDLNK